jgi:hypothetical protein
MIAGFGYFARFSVLPDWLAWGRSGRPTVFRVSRPFAPGCRVSRTALASRRTQVDG